MANVDCANCGHQMSEHKSRDFGPTVCTIEGCACRSGLAQRDDLVDIIMDQKEFLEQLKERVELPTETYVHIHEFLCSLEKRLEYVR